MGRSKKKSRERKYSSAKKRVETHKTGWQPTAFDRPEGASSFGLDKEGIRKVDILPFEAKEGNPFADEGELHYERTYWVHRGVGANQDSYVCSAKTVNKKCPICEVRQKLMKDPEADEEQIKLLAPKERQLWNVLDRDEPDKGVQIWDISFHLFGKLLDKEIRNSDEDEEFDTFFYLEGGKTLKLGIGERSFGGKAFYEVETVGFKNRPTDYDDDILEQVHCLDDLLIVMDYEKLKAIFLQVEDEDDEEDEDDDEQEEKEEKKPLKSKPKPKAKPKPKPKDEDEDEDEDEEESSGAIATGDTVFYKDMPCEVLKIGGDGKILKVEDPDGDIHKVDLDEIETEPPPEKKKGKSKKEEETEDDDDWDDFGSDDEEEKPAKKPSAKSKTKSKPKEEKKEDEDDDDWDDWED